MFDRDYRLKGKHAIYAQYLRIPIVTEFPRNVSGDGSDTAGVFKRHIDIYMIGAIMGFLHGRQSPEDKTTKDDVMIFADAFIREKAKCEFIFRIIMLLDETTVLTLEQRCDRAFRDDTDEQAMAKNMDLFHSYMRGGIEYLYEKFNEDCVTKDDYIDKLYEIVDRFSYDINGRSYEDLIQGIITNG